MVWIEIFELKMAKNDMNDMNDTKSHRVLHMGNSMEVGVIGVIGVIRQKIKVPQEMEVMKISKNEQKNVFRLSLLQDRKTTI